MARFLPILEAALANRDWLEGDFSLADIEYAPHSFLLAESGFDFSPYPRLRAWQDRLEKRPGWKKAEEMIFAE